VNLAISPAPPEIADGNMLAAIAIAAPRMSSGISDPPIASRKKSGWFRAIVEKRPLRFSLMIVARVLSRWHAVRYSISPPEEKNCAFPDVKPKKP
jgi:hypothetical protein